MNVERINSIADERGPLIYVYRIGADCYVGKAARGLDRAVSEYANNVRKLLAGHPYRKGKPDAWRRVHRRLADAVRNGETITLELYASTAATLNADEARLIAALRPSLNGAAVQPINRRPRAA